MAFEEDKESIAQNIEAAGKYRQSADLRRHMALRGIVEIAGLNEVGPTVVYRDLRQSAPPLHYAFYEQPNAPQLADKRYQSGDSEVRRAYHDEAFCTLAAQYVGKGVTCTIISPGETIPKGSGILSLLVPQQGSLPERHIVFENLDVADDQEVTDDHKKAVNFVANYYQRVLTPVEEISDEEFFEHWLPLRIAIGENFEGAAQYIGNTRPQWGNKLAHCRNVALGGAFVHRFFIEKLGIVSSVFSRLKEQATYHAGLLHDSGLVHNLAKVHLPIFTGRSAYEIAQEAAQKLIEQGAEYRDQNLHDLTMNLCASIISDRKDKLFAAAKALDSTGTEIGIVHRYFKRSDVHNPLDFVRRVMHYHGGADYGKHHDRHKNPTASGIDVTTATATIAMMVDYLEGALGDSRSLDEIVIDFMGVAKSGIIDPAYIKLFFQGYGTGKSGIEQWFKLSRQRDDELGERTTLRMESEFRDKSIDIDNLVKGLLGDPDAAKKFKQALGDYGGWKQFTKGGLETLKQKLKEILDRKTQKSDEKFNPVAILVQETIYDLPNLQPGVFARELEGIGLKNWIIAQRALEKLIIRIATTDMSEQDIADSLIARTSIEQTLTCRFATDSHLDLTLREFFTAVKEGNADRHPALWDKPQDQLIALDTKLKKAAELHAEARKKWLLENRQANRQGSFANFVHIDSERPEESRIYLQRRTRSAGGGLSSWGGLDEKGDYDPVKTVEREIQEELGELEGLVDETTLSRAHELLKVIRDGLKSVELQKGAVFQDNAHFIERGWGFVVDAHANMAVIRTDIASAFQELEAIISRVRQEAQRPGAEVASIVSYTYEEAPLRLLDFHHPHEALAVVMQFAVELKKSGIEPQQVWDHFNRGIDDIKITGDMETDVLPAELERSEDTILSIASSRAGLTLRGFKTAFDGYMDSLESAPSDHYYTIDIVNYVAALCQEELRREYFDDKNAPVYGKAPIQSDRAVQIKTEEDLKRYVRKNSHGELENTFTPPDPDDSTSIPKIGDWVVHPPKYNETTGKPIVENGKYVLDKSKGYVIRKNKFYDIYKLSDDGEYWIAKSVDPMQLLTEATPLRSLWDPHHAVTIQAGGYVVHAKSIGEYYPIPERSALRERVRLTLDGQMICRLSDSLDEQREALEKKFKEFALERLAINQPKEIRRLDRELSNLTAHFQALNGLRFNDRDYSYEIPKLEDYQNAPGLAFKWHSSICRHGGIAEQLCWAIGRARGLAVRVYRHLKDRKPS